MLMMTAVMRNIIYMGSRKHVRSAFENEKNVTYEGNLRELLYFAGNISPRLGLRYSVLVHRKRIIFSKTSKYKIEKS